MIPNKRSISKLLFAISCTTAMFSHAADIEWTGEASYELGEDDVLTFSSDQTITSISEFTGTGTIRVAGGALTLQYNPLTTGHPFLNFAGRIQIDEGATLVGNTGLHGEGKNNQANYGFGENTTIVFNGGTVSPVSSGSNNDYFSAVVVNEGKNALIENKSSRSGNNTGVHLNMHKPISGSGAISIVRSTRRLELKADNSGFTGSLNVTTEKTADGLWFKTPASTSEQASYSHNGSERIYFDRESSSDAFKIGSLTTGESTAGIDIVRDGTTLEVGAKADSSIDVPFFTRPFSLVKKGSTTTLTLGADVSFVDGSSVSVEEGALSVSGLDLTAATLAFSVGTRLDAVGGGVSVKAGTAFPEINLQSGAMVSVKASRDWLDGETVTLFTYASKGEGLVFSADNVFVSGVAGNGYVKEITDDGNGKVTAFAVIPTLYWRNLANADWTTPDAWSSADGNTNYTYIAGDRVGFRVESVGDVVATNVVTLSSAVLPTAVTVVADEGCAVKFVGVDDASISVLDQFVNNGTAIFAGEITLASPVEGSGRIVVESGVLDMTSDHRQAVEILGGAKVVLSKAQTFSVDPLVPFSGAGTLVLTDSYIKDLYTDNFTNFTGVLEITGGATAGIKTKGDRFEMGEGASVRLNGGTLQGGGNGTYVDMPFEIVEGTTNSFWSENANMTVGSLSGKGTLVYYTTKGRGPQLKQNNGSFEGTLVLRGSNFAPPTGFYGNSSGSAKATWILDSNFSTTRDGDMTYTIFDQDVSGEPIQFGVLQQTGPQAYIRAGSSKQIRNGMKIEVGAVSGGESVIEGRFSCSSVNLKKVGADSWLTLGTNFSMVAGSTLDVAAGGLGFKLPEDDSVVILTNSTVTIDQSVKFRVSMTQAQFEALDRNEDYVLARLSDKPQIRPVTTLLVDGSEPEAKSAKSWRAYFVNVPADELTGTAAHVDVVLRYYGPGFVISIR